MQALPGPHTNNLPQLMQENLGEVLKKMKVNGQCQVNPPNPRPATHRTQWMWSGQSNQPTCCWAAGSPRSPPQQKPLPLLAMLLNKVNAIAQGWRVWGKAGELFACLLSRVWKGLVAVVLMLMALGWKSVVVVEGLGQEVFWLELVVHFQPATASRQYHSD